MMNGFNKVLEGITSFNEIIRMLDVKIDLNDNQKDLKDYILGNTTKLETTDKNIEIKEQNNEVQVIEQNIIENVQPIEEEQPIIEDTTIEEQPQLVEVQDETQIKVQEPPTSEELQTEANEHPVPQKQMPTEGEKLIEEISEMFKDDIGEFNILAEMLSENNSPIEETPIESNIEETKTIDEITESTKEEPPIEETQIEQSIEETPIEEEDAAPVPESSAEM